MTLTDELEKFREVDVVIVMKEKLGGGDRTVTSRAFRGRLLKFDEEAIVLKNVYESLNELSPDGRMVWRRILHSKVILNVMMVLRIWPWDAPKVVTHT